MRDAILHFILYYNEFQGLLPVLIQTQKTVESLKFNEKWLRHKNFVLQNENAALEKVNGDLAKLIDQRVIRLDDLENEEKRRQENIDRLTTEEGNCLKRLEQIKNKITSRLEALASLDREISKKDIGVSSVTSATPIYLEMPVKESGVTYFQSDKTTLNSGVTMSGFAS
jgi:hypothetical protein